MGCGEMRLEKKTGGRDREVGRILRQKGMELWEREEGELKRGITES